MARPNTFFLAGILICTSVSAFADAGHLGWCNGAGNPHHVSSCGGGTRPPMTPLPGLVPISSQLSGGAVPLTPTSVPVLSPMQIPTPTPTTAPQMVPQIVAVPGQVPTQVPTPTPTATPMLVPRPKPARTASIPSGTPGTMTHSPTPNGPASAKTHVTSAPGRQAQHAAPQFAADDGGQPWNCLASGHGMGRSFVDGKIVVAGALRHAGAIDVLGRDLPALHPGRRDCNISVRRRGEQATKGDMHRARPDEPPAWSSCMQDARLFRHQKRILKLCQGDPNFGLFAQKVLIGAPVSGDPDAAQP